MLKGFYLFTGIDNENKVRILYQNFDDIYFKTMIFNENEINPNGSDTREITKDEYNEAYALYMVLCHGS